MHALTLWIIRIAIAVYLSGFLVRLRGSWEGRIGGRLSLFSWQTAAVLNLLHVLMAMHVFHHWSHTAATQHVVEETNRVTGFESGVGIYVNYVFTCWWLADAFLMQRRREYLQFGSRRAVNSQGGELSQPSARPNRYDLIAEFAVIFIVVNATVVFGPWWWKPIGVGVVVLAILARKSHPTGKSTD